MADLDPRLQRAAAEYLEHRNAQYRAARKYGPVLVGVFVALFVAAAVGIVWLVTSA